MKILGKITQGFTTRRLLTILGFAFLGTVTQVDVLADPITYMLTTTASGSLGGTSFTNAPITVTFAGDTSNIIAGSGANAGTLGEFGSATVIVSGIGAATLTDPAFILSTFDNLSLFGASGVVIGDTNVAGLVAATGPDWFGYNLQSIAPVTGPGGLGNGGGPGNLFPTTLGLLEFPRVQPPVSVGSTFTAVNTQTLTGFQGGTTSAPVFLVGGPVGELTGTISGFGDEDYYTFNWGGGVFAATASITGAASDASYLFSAGLSAGGCNSVASQTLNSGDAFSATISAGNLAPGQYCIGIDANSAADPNFTLTFNTPVTGVPEPGTFGLLFGGLAAFAAVRRPRARGTR